MKNLTIAVDDETLRASREYAYAQGTSLNALIRAYLRDIATPQPERSPIDEFLALGSQFNARLDGQRWTREELHER